MQLELELKPLIHGGGDRWGSKDNRKHANYGKDWCCAGMADGEDKWVYTSPTGSFPANPFGLYDMQGNVWEWVQDNYSAYSDEFVRDPMVRNGGENYVIRGGSWRNDSKDITSVKRVSKKFDTRNNNIGFRLAQDQSNK